MNRSRLTSVLAHLHRTFNPNGVNGPMDAELLDRFIRLRDEAAFELLVWRHERMVLGLCRRLLRDEHDAEDAFQATFLTLARKAASIGRREAVASWLHKVAYRCALRMRAAGLRQRQGIVSGIDPTSIAAPDPALAAVEYNDLREVLDEEVQRLPAKYRAAIVLCYLEGKSYRQAAEELGCPAGTLSARLHQARERLRIRLTARGIASAAATLTLLESVRATPAAARLAAIAVQAARRAAAGQSAADVVSVRTLEVCTGVIQAMSASKQKFVAISLLMGCLFSLTSWAAFRPASTPLSERSAANTDKPLSSEKGGKTVTWQECARLRGSLGPAASYVHFSPDGTALAAVGPDAILRLWNTSNWEPRWQYDCRRSYGEHFGDFTRFSPDGRFIGLTGSVPDADKPSQRKQEITLLDVASGREVAHLPGSWSTYAPDRVTAAIWRGDRITLWDLKTFREKRTLTATDSLIQFVMTFSKDAAFLCAPTPAGRCYLWETVTGKERARPDGFMPQFSPDGKTLLTILPGGIVKLWDTADGRERATIRNPGRIGCVASFSADGKRLLVHASVGLKANGDFDFPKGKLRREWRIHPIDVRLYDSQTGEERGRLPGDSPLNFVSAAFALGGRVVVYDRLERDETDRHEVVLWDVEAGKERAVLRAAEGVRYSGHTNGAMVLTTDDFGKNLRLWDVATGRLLLDLPADSSMNLSPDGQWLVATPQLLMQPAVGDIRVFRRSEKPLPPPIMRGQAVKPRTPPPSPPELPKSEARRALDAVRKEAEKYDQENLPKFKDAKPGPELDQLSRERRAAYQRLAAKALKCAGEFPADPVALEALEYVLRITGGGTDGETDKLRDEALALVLRDHRRSPELTSLLYWMSHQYTDSAEKTLAALAEDNPHRVVRGRAASRLAGVLAQKAEGARLVRVLPELLDDPELIDRKSRLKKLQTIDPDEAARSAEEWYGKVREHFADVPLNDGQKDTLGQGTERGLFALRNLAIGKVAPDIAGEDLDGKHFSLKDYRGKVVVLIFCGHWCGPCRQMNPQKQKLIERHADKPFALLEVNSDDDRETVRRTMRREKLTWRCWIDGSREGPIARRWDVHGWPTIFVLDGKGVIRFKELRGPMLDRVVDRLLSENSPGG